MKFLKLRNNKVHLSFSKESIRDLEVLYNMFEIEPVWMSDIWEHRINIEHLENIEQTIDLIEWDNLKNISDKLLMCFIENIAFIKNRIQYFEFLKKFKLKI